MKLTKLPLAKWQGLLYEFEKQVPLFQPAAFRVDGTPFSVGIFFGAFKYNDVTYTVVGAAEDGAYLAIHPAFSAWLAKRKETKRRITPHSGQLTMELT